MRRVWLPITGSETRSWIDAARSASRAACPARNQGLACFVLEKPFIGTRVSAPSSSARRWPGVISLRTPSSKFTSSMVLASVISCGPNPGPSCPSCPWRIPSATGSRVRRWASTSTAICTNRSVSPCSQAIHPSSANALASERINERSSSRNRDHGSLAPAFCTSAGPAELAMHHDTTRVADSLSVAGMPSRASRNRR